MTSAPSSNWGGLNERWFAASALGGPDTATRNRRQAASGSPIETQIFPILLDSDRPEIDDEVILGFYDKGNKAAGTRFPTGNNSYPPDARALSVPP